MSSKDLETFYWHHLFLFVASFVVDISIYRGNSVFIFSVGDIYCCTKFYIVLYFGVHIISKWYILMLIFLFGVILYCTCFYLMSFFVVNIFWCHSLLQKFLFGESFVAHDSIWSYLLMHTFLFGVILWCTYFCVNLSFLVSFFVLILLFGAILSCNYLYLVSSIFVNIYIWCHTLLRIFIFAQT